MPAPSRQHAGTASQLIPGVRRTCEVARRRTAAANADATEVRGSAELSSSTPIDLGMRSSRLVRDWLFDVYGGAG